MYWFRLRWMGLSVEVDGRVMLSVEAENGRQRRLGSLDDDGCKVSVEKAGRCVVDLMCSYVKQSQCGEVWPPELLRLSVEPEVTVLTGEQELAGCTKK